ncbi:MAG: hypothetical protein WCQ21_31655 [Verrucomicrobiota bacterium]
MKRLFKHTRICAGPTSPIVSGGHGPTEVDEARKLTPDACSAEAVTGLLEEVAFCSGGKSGGSVPWGDSTNRRRIRLLGKI